MDKLQKLMDRIGYQFNNIDLLIQSLTHRSYVNESFNDARICDNEKLEFLGDSVLNLVTTEYMMENFKFLNEGELSKIKSQIISETAFSTVSREIRLGDYLFLSKGENASGGRDRNSILADAFEALIGAIFLDSNYYTVRQIAIKLLKDKIHNLDQIEGIGDYKTQFQELIQSKFKTTPIYNLIETYGPDHDKVFKVNVCVNDEVICEGIAKSKKKAEKQAAKKAMIKLGYL